jgi:eukaryotic-like serine/threonine-protein kinase
VKCPACSHDSPDSARFCGSCGARLERAADASEGLVGQVVDGRYRVLRVVGQGGMGVVYEAEQTMGDHVRRVAIKTLLPTLSADATLAARFHRELGIVSRLEHPNTIRCFDSGQTADGTLYVVMEFVHGTPLGDVIDQGALGWPRAEHLLGQVCGALAEAHDLGIVHRDLKPDNILLTERAGDRDFVKLLDFGIAIEPASLARTKLTQQGIVLGTPPYMSPEQLAGKPVGPASDIYSLGIIAYEMLTGELPFQAESSWEWATHHINHPPRPIESWPVGQLLPAPVKRGIMHALAKNPLERPPSTLELFHELRGEIEVVRTEPGRTVEPRPVTDGGHDTERAPAFAPAEIPAWGGTQPYVAPAPAIPKSRSFIWFALGSLALVATAAVAATIVLLPEPDVEPPLPDAAPGESSAVVMIEPLIDAESILEPTGGADAHAALHPKTPRPPASKPPTAPTVPQLPTPTPTPVPTPTPTPVPTPTPQPPATTPPPPPPGGDAACRSAVALANGEQIEAAASALRQCESTGGSTALQGSARRSIQTRAPGVVKRRAFNGDCPGARGAANAASSVGAGGPAQAELARTSCR